MQRELIRFIDIAIAVLAIILLSPVLLGTSLVVWWDLGFPIIFRQTRLGEAGNAFTVYKFRSMRQERLETAEDLEKVNPYTIKLKQDPRVTRLGAFLRRTSLDELPQLLNVLKGDMSIVGPRPFVPEEYEHFPPLWKQRLNVKPGITGLAQIAGRSDLPMEEIVRLDRVWVEGYSVKLYTKVLFQTFGAVAKMKNVY